MMLSAPAPFLPVLILTEEAGWRGFLQPELEKRIPFPFSVLEDAALNTLRDTLLGRK